MDRDGVCWLVGIGMLIVVVYYKDVDSWLVGIGMLIGIWIVDKL